MYWILHIPIGHMLAEFAIPLEYWMLRMRGSRRYGCILSVEYGRCVGMNTTGEEGESDMSPADHRNAWCLFVLIYCKVLLTISSSSFAPSDALEQELAPAR